jgi:Cu+-exporting ATPase
MSGPATIRRDLPIAGMTCASCVGRVERALRAIAGVREATVNLVTERAAVTWDPAVVSVVELSRAVEDAGYELEPPADDRETTIPVHGMTCAACVGRVERALSAIPGVATATVNLVTERATVVHDPTIAPVSALEEALRDAGYDVGDVGDPMPPRPRRVPPRTGRTRTRPCGAHETT